MPFASVISFTGTSCARNDTVSATNKIKAVSCLRRFFIFINRFVRLGETTLNKGRSTTMQKRTLDQTGRIMATSDTTLLDSCYDEETISSAPKMPISAVGLRHRDFESELGGA